MFTVLIVEDDVAISAQIQIAINSIDRDIKVYKSKEGIKALKMAEMLRFDLFILDIGLPDWDGIELAKELRKTYPSSPIIIESSERDSRYQSQIHDEIENLAFLKKPYTIDHLILKVNHALDIAQNLNTKILKLEQHGFTRMIVLNDLLYIEKIKGKKNLELVLYNQHQNRLIREEFRNLSLSGLLEKMKDKNLLLRCHKGFIINPKMIERLNYAHNTVSLKYTEAEIPIGKTYKEAVSLLL